MVRVRYRRLYVACPSCGQTESIKQKQAPYHTDSAESITSDLSTPGHQNNLSFNKSACREFDVWHSTCATCMVLCPRRLTACLLGIKLQAVFLGCIDPRFWRRHRTAHTWSDRQGNKPTSKAGIPTFSHSRSNLSRSLSFLLVLRWFKQPPARVTAKQGTPFIRGS